MKESEKETGFVKWFSELNKASGPIAGGKGANLAEMYNFKIPVPPGFIVTAQAYDYFIKKAGLDAKIAELISNVKYEDTDQLTKTSKEIRHLIESSSMSKEMEEEILEAYETLGVDDLNLSDKNASYIIKKSAEPFVAVRSSATTEDLAEASFAGQQDSFLNVKGKTQLISNIKKCISSLFTPRAIYYRRKKGFEHVKASLAVVVQRMIDSDKSGVIFSKDPSLNVNHVIVEAVFGLGEGIVSGQITPDNYIVVEKEGVLEITERNISKKKIAITKDEAGNEKIVKLKEEKSTQQVLKDHEIRKLAELALKLERHYGKPQDIEFAIEGDGIYIVQTRPITTIKKEGAGEEGKEKNLHGEVILSGIPASPGIGSGKIKIVEDLKDLDKVNPGDILVTKMTNPDMVVTMQKAAAIVTNEGGLTAHAAIVSREMGIPAVVGTQEATTKLKEGEIITVDGYTGKIYKGKVAESVKKEIKSTTAKTKTEIKVIIDIPSFAQRAAKTGLRSVGLARVEGIIAESGKHPKYFLDNGNIEEYEAIIFKGISEIAKHFDEVWVRTSDIRSDEFENLLGSPKEKEANPMLGMHGIRYSIKYPEIIKAELKAMARVAGHGKKIGVLTPQVISLEEVKKLKQFIKEVGFKKAKVGVMVETPAAVELIEDFCKEGIEFISFGSNDLTQYTLAVDRGNEQVQSLYDDLHPAVLSQIARVIATCKKHGVETSICGQAGSKKEMVKFLVEHGISSISINADVAADIAQYVSELENGISGSTNEEPEESNGDEEGSENGGLDIGREMRQDLEIPKINGVEYLQKDSGIEQGENEVTHFF